MYLKADTLWRASATTCTLKASTSQSSCFFIIYIIIQHLIICTSCLSCVINSSLSKVTTLLWWEAMMSVFDNSCCSEQRKPAWRKYSDCLPALHVLSVKQLNIAQECAETYKRATDTVFTLMPFTWVTFTICLPVRQRPHPTSAHWFSRPLRYVSCLFPSGQRGVASICWWVQRNVLNEQHVSSGPTWFIIHAVCWVLQQWCWEFNERYYTKYLRGRWIIHCQLCHAFGI